jgi:hypothetical protein
MPFLLDFTRRPEEKLLTVRRKFCLPHLEKSPYRGKKKLLTVKRKFSLPSTVKSSYRAHAEIVLKTDIVNNLFQFLPYLIQQVYILQKGIFCGAQVASTIMGPLLSVSSVFVASSFFRKMIITDGTIS